MWQEFSLKIDRAQVDRFQEALFATGATAVTITEADPGGDVEVPIEANTTPSWPWVRLSALYPETTDLEAVRQSIMQTLELDALPAWRTDTVRDQDWERANLRDLRPVGFGDRLWVCPTGCSPPQYADAVVHIDPGLAFGTGTHPSTALCLEWLDRARLGNCHLLDYGCGSGILAIAAVLLGARQATAVDNDEQALQVTMRNAKRNGVARRILVCSPESVPPTKFDVLVANILASPLIELASTFAGLLKTGGRIVLSGILHSQADELVDAYKPYFDIRELASHADWVRVAGVLRRSRTG